MAPHSSALAWNIPWMEEPSRLQSMWSRRVGHDCATSLSLFSFMHWRRKWQPTPVFLPGESQERGSLVGCRLWGRTESLFRGGAQILRWLFDLSFPMSTSSSTVYFIGCRCSPLFYLNTTTELGCSLFIIIIFFFVTLCLQSFLSDHFSVLCKHFQLIRIVRFYTSGSTCNCQSFSSSLLCCLLSVGAYFCCQIKIF